MGFLENSRYHMSGIVLKEAGLCTMVQIIIRVFLQCSPILGHSNSWKLTTTYIRIWT